MDLMTLCIFCQLHYFAIAILSADILDQDTFVFVLQICAPSKFSSWYYSGTYFEKSNWNLNNKWLMWSNSIAQGLMLFCCSQLVNPEQSCL